MVVGANSSTTAKGMRLHGPNITAGGTVGHYTAQDWGTRGAPWGQVRWAAPFIMPSEDYNRLTDTDLAALGLCCAQPASPPGRRTVVELPLPVQALMAWVPSRDAYEKIDHHLPPAQPVTVAVNAEHGAYVAQMCRVATAPVSPAAQFLAAHPIGHPRRT